MQLWGFLVLKGVVRISLPTSFVGGISEETTQLCLLAAGPQPGPPGTAGGEGLWVQEGAGHGPGGTQLNAAAEGHRGG